MKISLSNLLQMIERQELSFNPIKITEEEYDYYSKATIFNSFILTEKMLFRLSSEVVLNERVYKLLPISTHIEIIKKLFNVSNQECSYLVKNQEGEEFEVSSEILTAVGCKQLLKKGCIYIERQVKQLLDFLSEAALKAPTETVYDKLGWDTVDNNYVFYSGVSVNNIGYKSRYIGSVDFKSTGNKEDYTDMLTDEVFGNVAMTFIFILGFASIILSYLNMFYDLGTLIFAVSNSSSKGKTTAGMLCASVYSNPIINRGLMSTFCATNNALLNLVASNAAHTIVLDELATSEAKNMRKLLYQLCSGQDKMRLNTDSIMKETKKFDSVILTTAEFSIIDDSAPNGIKARVFEIKDPLTSSAENSNIIKKTVISNHALLSDGFSAFVLNHIEDIVVDYEKSKKELNDDFKAENGELTARVFDKLAVILLTAKYVKNCFNFDFDINSIKQYIYKLEMQIRSESDIADKAFQHLMEYVIRNGNRFIDGCLPNIVTSAEGRITSRGNLCEIAILKSVAEKELKNLGFENYKVLQEKWRQKGILVEESDRSLKRVRFARNLQPQACYVFKVNSDEINISQKCFDDNIQVVSTDDLQL